MTTSLSLETSSSAVHSAAVTTTTMSATDVASSDVAMTEEETKAAKRKENDELRAVRGAKIRAGFAAKKIREAKEKEEKEKEKERQAKE